jgi:hypothetical protein
MANDSPVEMVSVVDEGDSDLRFIFNSDPQENAETPFLNTSRTGGLLSPSDSR